MQETYTLSTERKIKPYLLFLIICLLLYLPPALFRAPLYPDEVRNFYITENITTAKDFLIPYYLEDRYYEKPPLYFWILKLFSRVPGASLLFLSILFNTLVSWALLSLNYLFLKREGYPRIGFISSLLLSTIGIFYGMSILARMDILFLFFTFLSLNFLWLSAKRNKIYFIFLASLSSFLAVFTKGAFGIIFPLFIGLGMSLIFKDKRLLGKVIVINLLTAISILIWIFSFSQLDKIYFEKMILDQTIGRGFAPHAHGEPFFYYLPFLFLLMLPWSFLGIGYFINLKRNKFYSWEKVFLFWLLGGLFILSAIRSKVPMYLLLLAIPFCSLVAKFILEGRDNLRKILFYLTGGFFIFSWLGGFFYCKITGEFIPNSAFIALVLFLGACLLLIRKEPLTQFRNFFIAWVLIIQAMNFIYLPLASRESGFNKIATFIKNSELKFNKIYTDDRKFYQLRIYSLNKPIDFLEDNVSFCKEKEAVLISGQKEFSCQLRKLIAIDDFTIFYKEK